MNTHQKFKTYTPGQHVVRGIPFKAHKIDGFTPEMLEQHFEQVYGGTVRRLNEIEKQIARNDHNSALWEKHLAAANAVILHELHFFSLGEEGGEELSDATLKQAIDAAFGSFAAWQVEFSSMATSAEGGWAILAWSDRFDRLMNVRTVDDAHALSDTAPLLALDMGAYAFSSDFGSDRQSYVSAFLQSVHWVRVAERFHRSLGRTVRDEDSDPNQISISELKAGLDQGDDVLVLDVRHDDDCERYRNRITGSAWRDSFDVAAWANDLPKDKPVVVYCMYGFWVSQKAAEELRAYGIDARSLSGGVTAWRAMGYSSSSYID
ncbi:Fe-Mn family superoxide dismutase [Ruegeria sp. EL01]|uniref:Fe-Mn family superoxide dismutase n=1 Tax=Ruegeria sp. EL01 TaxID=2107578 RepID=UPI0013C509EA|nr:Fe-Mn family superoxide dismutase [Ruegeria sp. EL01]